MNLRHATIRWVDTAVGYVPSMSGDSLRLFRVLLAGCLIAVALFSSNINALSESRLAMAWITLCAIGFGIGWYPRIFFGGIVAAFIWLTLVEVERRSVHDLTLPVITMIGWLFVPWGAPRRERSPANGFALWWPSVTLGMAFASAAFTKLRRFGLFWITSGAVRYHFVMDAANAPSQAGLRVAGSYPASVLFSLAAVVLESTVILAAFMPAPAMRLLFFCEAAGLLFGFWLMQGVFWPLWWICALALLPWHARDEAAGASIHMTVPQYVIAGLFVLMQAIVTVAGIEREPYFSNFPMYSDTYNSTDEFDEETRARYTRVVSAEAGGTSFTDKVLALPQDAKSTLVRIAEGTRYSQDGLRDVCTRLDPVPPAVELTVERTAFNWRAGRFNPPRQMTLPPALLAEACRPAVP